MEACRKHSFLGGGTTSPPAVEHTGENLKHNCREHKQETDRFADLRAEGKPSATVKTLKNREDWKAVRGYWDGSAKGEGRSRFGVVLHAVARYGWITTCTLSIFTEEMHGHDCGKKRCVCVCVS